MDSRRLNDQELAAIEERLQQASPGPWHAEDDQVFSRGEVLADICCGEIEQAMRDAVFFANARADVERLLITVRQLRDELGKARR